MYSTKSQKGVLSMPDYQIFTISYQVSSLSIPSDVHFHHFGSSLISLSEQIVKLFIQNYKILVYGVPFVLYLR